ncbi:hypothetical protein ACFWM7_03725 [Streptomyces sp. NPDC058375]|uniref:hypothetical protein n=1 Tax=Streptomyces sp. NPDC058375 TaxID=3346467 RepID=UPI003665013D
MTITNEQLAGHTLLALLYEDDCFPDHVLDKGTAVLDARPARRWARPSGPSPRRTALTDADPKELIARRDW